jgi:hypothetical protein
VFGGDDTCTDSDGDEALRTEEVAVAEAKEIEAGPAPTLEPTIKREPSDIRRQQQPMCVRSAQRRAVWARGGAGDPRAHGQAEEAAAVVRLQAEEAVDPKKQKMCEGCGLKRQGYGLALEENKKAVTTIAMLIDEAGQRAVVAATVGTLTVVEMLAELRRLQLPTSGARCPGGRKAALLTCVHGLGLCSWQRFWSGQLPPTGSDIYIGSDRSSGSGSNAPKKT